ncbi:25S rRNA (adenine645-N1)-methyltransferase [Umbelopsis sp. WA50703]
MQGLFDAPGWNLGTIAEEKPAKLSKTQQKKAFKKKKMVEEALGQALPRKPKVKNEAAADGNASSESNKRKSEINQSESSEKASKKQKPSGAQKETGTAQSTKEAEAKLSIGQGTNRSNYVSVMTADEPSVTHTKPMAEPMISVMKVDQHKSNGKSAKKGKAAAKTEKVSEQSKTVVSEQPKTVVSEQPETIVFEQPKTIDVSASLEPKSVSEVVLSKTQQKKLARQQMILAKEGSKAKADTESTDSKPMAPTSTKKVNEKQKKKLQAALAKSASSQNEKATAQKNEDKKAPKPQTQPDEAPAKQQPKLTPLQQKMKEKLSGSRFRWLNEQLYTTPGDEAFTLFQEKPELFDHYHEGFRHQVESWPTNPVDVMIDYLRAMPTSTVVADFGCGDAKIAHTLTKHKVLSFDLVAKNDKVVACDIAKLPLPDGLVDVAIFCLSLMGTNYVDFVLEAHRVLKEGGELKVAEVISRFSDVDAFIQLMEELGFEFMDKDDSNKMFILLDFVKKPEYAALDGEDTEMLKGLNKKQKKALQKGLGGSKTKNPEKLNRLAQDLLKPCLYKKR